jgi:rod shape determining protein RodA
MINEPPSKKDFGTQEWLLLLSSVAILLIGIAFIYSARYTTESNEDFPWYQKYYVKQMVFYLMGISAAVVINLLDYHSWARWSLVGYWGAIILLLLVPVIGKSAGGAQRWIDLGFFNFQPSEVAKIALILMLASFLSRPLEELRLVGNFWKAIAMMLLPFVLIMAEPDLGSALVLIPIGLVMMFVGGVPLRYLSRLIGGVGLLMLLLLLNILFAPKHWQIALHEYQRQRLLVYFGMDFADDNATEAEKIAAKNLQDEKSYQVRQALITVGSGGLWGTGWTEGQQTALHYLPPGAAHNDFIFSVIAEEKGFIGSLTLITLYGVILFTGIRIASQARDRLGKLLAVGVVTLVFSQVFINIGMNIRIMPVTGVPLPLLSYGGTSVIVSLVAIGMLHNVHLYRRVY